MAALSASDPKTYAVAWTEANRLGQIVTKERAFTTDAARARFIERLEERPSFLRIERYADPEAR